jgi:TonB family protein
MTPDAELNIFPLGEPEGSNRRLWIALAASVGIHIIVLVVLPYVPAGAVPNFNAPRIHLMDLSKSTPLIEPVLPKPSKLTQKDPNKGKVGTELSMADLLPKPALPRQVERASTPRQMASLPGTPAPPIPKPIEAPKIDTQQTDVSQLKGPAALGTAQIQPVEKPKLAFEKVGTSMGAPIAPGVGAPKLEPPKSSVDDAVRSVVRGSGRGGLVVGDTGEGPGGVSEMLGQSPQSGAARSALELLSDPQGVDFRPYLVQILAAVRRNWKAVMPESARLGRRGLTILQFSISRNGGVPKLVIATPSGTEALDRAAVAGVSASNPFPPLPAEFKGNEIRLEFRFSYNMPAR